MKIISNSSFGIGDAIHGLYAVEAYKQLYPNEEVVYKNTQCHWLQDVEGINQEYYQSGDTLDIHSTYDNKIKNAPSSKVEYCNIIHQGLLPIAPKMKFTHIGNGGYIVLSVHASRANRTWELNKWVQLESRIIKSLGLKTIIIGTSSHKERNKDVFTDYSRFKGKVLIDKSPSEIRDILLNCKLLISCESGIAHFAALYNVPTLALIAQLKASYLYDYTNVVAVNSERICTGCHFKQSNGYLSVCETKCYSLVNLTVDMVYEKITIFDDIKNILNDMYLAYLGREIDLYGLNVFSNLYKNGATLNAIKNIILNAEEYTRLNQSLPYDHTVDITLQTGIQSGDGIGKVGLKYYLEFEKLGIKANTIIDVFVNSNLSTNTLIKLKKDNYKSIGKAYIMTGCSGLYPHVLPKFADNGETIAFRHTMYEADRIPDEWIRAYNNENTVAVIVPDEWVKKIFIESGITKPVEVVTLGCSSNFKLNEFKDNVFTFGITSQFEERKNHLLVIQAFKAAFPTDDNVRLKVHGRWGHLSNVLKFACKEDKRIEFLDSALSDNMYNEWWESLDAYVLPSAGEGFGFTPREALMRGIPTIISNYSAHEKLVNAGIVIPVEPVGLKDSYKAIFRKVIGKDAIIDVDNIVSAMLYVKENHTTEKERALKGREWLIENESWKKATQDLISVVGKYKHNNEVSYI